MTSTVEVVPPLVTGRVMLGIAQVVGHLLLKGYLSFPGTLTPAPSSLYDRECIFRVRPANLLIVTDPALPATFGVQLEGQVRAGTLRSADPTDAPGRREWWSATLEGNGKTGTLSADREYLQCLPDLGPFQAVDPQ